MNLFKSGVASAMIVAAGVASATPTTIFSENFNDVVTLQAPVDETGRGFDGQAVWTTAPTGGLAGWTFSQNINGDGAAEWKGWSFAKKNFWVTVAGDQDRSQFTKGDDIVAVADPDEYDDYKGGILGTPNYNVYMTTGDIDVSLVTSDIAFTFDSSWRYEGFDDGDGLNNQTAKIWASWDGGAFDTVLHWDSDPLGSFFKADATNETVTRTLIRPAGAQTLRIRFGMENANNDWWWAVDNLNMQADVVPEPTTMVVFGAGALAILRRRFAAK